jgi:hypothetical protein
MVVHRQRGWRRHRAAGRGSEVWVVGRLVNYLSVIHSSDEERSRVINIACSVFPFIIIFFLSVTFFGSSFHQDIE